MQLVQSAFVVGLYASYTKYTWEFSCVFSNEATLFFFFWWPLDQQAQLCIWAEQIYIYQLLLLLLKLHWLYLLLAIARASV